MLQFLAGRIEQQNTKHLVVDEAAQQLRDSLQQFVDIQNRGKLSRNFVQQNQSTGLACGARVKTGILNSHRHARSDQREQAFVLFGEVIRLGRLQIDDPDEAVLDD